MAQHIGIVACSAEGAALCYRTICVEGAALMGPHAHPEVSMHTPSLADYVAHLERNDWPAVGELMLAHGRPVVAIEMRHVVGERWRMHRTSGCACGPISAAPSTQMVR